MYRNAEYKLYPWQFQVPGPSKSSSVKQLVTEDISEEVTNRDSRSSSHTSTESNAASSILSRSEIEGGTSSSTSGRTTDDSAGPGTEDDEEGEVASSTDDGEGIENANMHNARERWVETVNLSTRNRFLSSPRIGFSFNGFL